MSRMRTLAVKLPDSLLEKVAQLARERHTTRSEIIRAALDAYSVAEGESFTEALSDLCGSLAGPGDLSTNPAYLDDLGA